MARERISEYTAKRMLLGDEYAGITLSSSNDQVFDTLGTGTYVVKVDQGVKKRFLQGLVAVNVSPSEAKTAIQKWERLGYSRFLLEQFVAHEATDERYVSFERVRGGVRVLWLDEGGVDVESATVPANSFLISDEASMGSLMEKGVPKPFIEHIVSLLTHEYVSFVEINPLLITEKGLILLDAAVLVDSAGSFFAHAWNEDDIIRLRSQYSEEAVVADLQRSTAASLKLSIMNQDGALFFLLSGGGGSIVALDAVHERGLGAEIGNYGEYSGGPTREETYLYSQQVLARMLKSKAPKKALVIAGGVANFTDVLKTFQGVIDAITEVALKMREEGIKIFVRRGGPNETAGLREMETFLRKEQLFGSVYGSDVPITTVVIEATEFVGEPISH